MGLLVKPLARTWYSMSIGLAVIRKKKYHYGFSCLPSVGNCICLQPNVFVQGELQDVNLSIPTSKGTFPASGLWFQLGLCYRSQSLNGLKDKGLSAICFDGTACILCLNLAYMEVGSVEYSADICSTYLPLTKELVQSVERFWCQCCSLDKHGSYK